MSGSVTGRGRIRDQKKSAGENPWDEGANEARSYLTRRKPSIRHVETLWAYIAHGPSLVFTSPPCVFLLHVNPRMWNTSRERMLAFLGSVVLREIHIFLLSFFPCLLSYVGPSLTIISFFSLHAATFDYYTARISFTSYRTQRPALDP